MTGPDAGGAVELWLHFADTPLRFAWNGSLTVNVWDAGVNVECFTLDEQASLVEVEAACRRHLSDRADAGLDRLCAFSFAGYGACVLQAGHDGDHRDANRYRFGEPFQVIGLWNGDPSES